MTARKVENHVEMPPEDARAGQTGLNMRLVMTVSIALVLLGFAALGFYWFG